MTTGRLSLAFAAHWNAHWRAAATTTDVQRSWRSVLFEREHAWFLRDDPPVDISLWMAAFDVVAKLLSLLEVAAAEVAAMVLVVWHG